jgi:hypothetical protein
MAGHQSHISGTDALRPFSPKKKQARQLRLKYLANPRRLTEEDGIY